LVVAESEFGARIEAAARDGRDPGPAFDALQVLRRLDPAAAGPIEAGFAESADPRVRLMLGELRGRDGVELMEPLFEHGDPEVRLRAAADLVAWLPPMEAAERAAMWSADDDVALRETALWVAARRGLPAFAVPDAVLRGLPVDVALDVGAGLATGSASEDFFLDVLGCSVTRSPEGPTGGWGLAEADFRGFVAATRFFYAMPRSAGKSAGGADPHHGASKVCCGPHGVPDDRRLGPSRGRSTRERRGSRRRAR
jgi:hypothetical protein